MGTRRQNHHVFAIELMHVAKEVVSYACNVENIPQTKKTNADKANRIIGATERVAITLEILSGAEVAMLRDFL